MRLKYEPASEPLHIYVKQLEEVCPARLDVVTLLPS